jgi:hypothetical protein
LGGLSLFLSQIHQGLIEIFGNIQNDLHGEF